MREEIGVLGETQSVRWGDQHTLSRTTIVDYGDPIRLKIFIKLLDCNLICLIFNNLFKDTHFVYQMIKHHRDEYVTGKKLLWVKYTRFKHVIGEWTQSEQTYLDYRSTQLSSLIILILCIIYSTIYSTCEKKNI